MNENTNTVAPEPEQAKTLATRPRQIHVVEDDSPLGYLFDSARFEHMWRIASAMAQSNLIPEHLRADKEGFFDLEEVKANCFQIVNQAVRGGDSIPFHFSKKAMSSMAISAGKASWSPPSSMPAPG